jgi:hypothetical protein
METLERNDFDGGLLENISPNKREILARVSHEALLALGPVYELHTKDGRSIPFIFT